MTSTVFPDREVRQRRQVALEELANVDAWIRSLAWRGDVQTTLHCEMLQQQVLRRRKLVRELRALEKLVKHRSVTRVENWVDPGTWNSPTLPLAHSHLRRDDRRPF